MNDRIQVKELQALFWYATVYNQAKEPDETWKSILFVIELFRTRYL